MRYFAVLWVSLLFLNPAKSLARWAGLADSPVILKSDTVTITVHKDGTSHAKRAAVFLVNNEQGRFALGNGLIKYNSRATKVTQIKAQTWNSDEKLDVERDYIEDKAIASSAEGFDETRQVSIAYPKVEVGSQLLLDYEMETTEVPIPNIYSNEFVFGDDVMEESTEITLNSPFELFLEKNDPTQALDIKQTKKGDYYTTKIKLLKAVSSRVADETDPKVTRRLTTWVVVSSVKEWKALALSMIEDYEKVLSAELPPLYQKIAEDAAKQKTLEEKINTVTSQLAESVRYLGDWRAVRGGHVPRPLSLVANTRFGDCKDFSAATVAILRKLGFESYIAWVERGVQSDPLTKLPLESAFNHAIVFMKDKSGVKWIDPTNTVSFAHGTFEDIMGRQALVIDPKGPRLEGISEGKPSDATVKRKVNIKFEKNGDAVLNAAIRYAGRSAIGLTGIERLYSKEAITHYITKSLADDNFILEKKVEPFNLQSRIVKDVELKASVKLKSYSIRTTAGTAYEVPRRDIGKLIDLDTKTRVSDLFLGYPTIESSTTSLKFSQVVGKLEKGCHIRSPWITFQRKYSPTPQGLDIQDEMIVLQSSIPIESLRAKEFQKFQSDLEKCIHKIGVVFKFKG